MPTCDERFGPLSISGVARGSRALGRLLAELELWLLHCLKREGASGLTAAIAELNGLGHDLVALPDEDPPRWSGRLPDGQRRLVVSGAASEAVEWVSARVEPIDADARRPEPDPRNAAFYARWQALLGLDVAAVEELRRPDRMVHHLAVLEAEVNNGGFLQYLDNTGGRWLDETLAMLAEIGAHRTRELLAEVKGLLLGARADRPDAWKAALVRLEASGVLGPFDDRFCSLGEDAPALAAAHLGLA